jgi:iron only hydrogenase large subunit-like protein
MKTGELKFPLKEKCVVMLAPSFVVDFSFPEIISQLKQLGFDKVVELTFGAKMVNREYHKKLENSKGLVISSVCPGIVETIKSKFPQYKKNLILVDSPMIAMAKVCKKFYAKHKIVFISPCNFKKIEAKNSGIVDYVLDYKQLKEILESNKIVSRNKNMNFDGFYNNYTKIYPLAGGLSKTIQLKGILKKEEIKVIDGINDVLKFLEKPDKKIKFFDCNFCKGGCIGGPCVNSKLPIILRKRKVISYMKKSKQKDIPESKKGLIEKANGINFLKKNF